MMGAHIFTPIPNSQRKPGKDYSGEAIEKGEGSKEHFSCQH